MESEEITKLVDGIYKNILDKFNPGTRQMINSGKAYLKTLHAAAAASRIYVDAITKLARQAQQATWAGCSDIGSALMQIVEVYKETQAQQMNILKAFYVDLLVPLETNLEKDTKVIQMEQKKFLQDHKQHIDSYHKAEALVKKYRKKQNNKGTKSGNSAVDKELRYMQALEEEKNKLDDFCERSLKNAITQERRRYGFVLERQCSLAKHFLAFHNNQQILLEKFVNTWLEIAKSREHLPEPVENMFIAKLREVNFYAEQDVTLHLNDEEESGNTQLRKAKAAEPLSDAETGPLATDKTNAPGKQHSLTRGTKSDYNMSSSTLSLHRIDDYPTVKRPMSLAITDNGWETIASNAGNNANNHGRTSLVRAIYSYLSNGENQLSFLKGDILSVIGERNKGWQYGENLRTHFSGWFPLTYTESFLDSNNNTTTITSYNKKSSHGKSDGEMYQDGDDSSPDVDNFEVNKSQNKYNGYKTQVTKFGDSVVQRQFHQTNQRGVLENAFSSMSIAPAVPTPVVPSSNTLNRTSEQQSNNQNSSAVKRSQNGNASLHSSNDSGFSNDPPPAPDADYSDDDTNRHVLLKKAYELKMAKLNSNNNHSSSSENAQKLKSNATDSSSSGAKKLNSNDANVRKRLPMRQSSSVGHLVTLGRHQSNGTSGNNANAMLSYDKKQLKRTKSLWKFKKTDDVLEGMSLWRHRSLVDINSESATAGTKYNGSSGTPIMNKRMSATKEILLNDSNGRRRDDRPIADYNGDDNDDYDDEEDDENVTIMNGSAENTLKKKTANYQRRNRNSANVESDDPSDPESCIVINDHRKTDLSLTRTGGSSMLPRMQLAKANSISSMKMDSGFKDNDSDLVFESSKLLSFKYNRIASESSWYDSWGERKKK